MTLLAWIFAFCMGSLVFTVTDLRRNHECTYAFSIAKVKLVLKLGFNQESLKYFYAYSKNINTFKFKNDYTLYKGYLNILKNVQVKIKTYFQEVQLSTTISFFLSILVVFILYGIILAKFYERRKGVDTIKRDLMTDFHPKLRKIDFSQIYLKLFPVKFHLSSDIIQNNSLHLKQIRFNEHRKMRPSYFLN